MIVRSHHAMMMGAPVRPHGLYDALPKTPKGNDMAPPRRPLTDLETPGAVGFKTTSLRLQGAQWAQADLFARAMGMSVNELIQKSVDAKQPAVQKAIQKQINQQKKLLDDMMKMAGGVFEEDEDEAEPEEADGTEDFEEVEEDED